MKNLIKFGLILSLAVVAVLPIASFGQSANTVSTVSSCVNLTYNMGPGSTDFNTGGQVTVLQNFLVSAGYGSFSGRASYGPLTFAAVQNFQRANGISPVGFVGPFTRAKIQSLTCGNVSSGVSISSITPSSGPIGTQVTLTGSGFLAGSMGCGGYTCPLNSSSVFPSCAILMNSANTGNCFSGYGITTIYLDNLPALQVSAVSNTSLTFTIPDGLQLSPGIHVLPGPLMVKVVNSNGTSNTMTFNVTSGTNSGSPSITSINPSAGSVGTQVQIYGNFSSTGNTIKFGNYSVGNPTYSEIAVPCMQGSSCPNQKILTFTVPQWAGYYCAPGMACPAIAVQITPGTYAVSVVNANGTSNAVNFLVTSASSTTGAAPVINGLSGPTTLTIGQTGTWTVNARDPQNGTLTYSVDWGDTSAQCTSYASCGASQNSAAAQAAGQQSSSFTHSYNVSGTYNVSFTVRNSSGQTAKTSTTVYVSSYSGGGNHVQPYVSYISPSAGPNGTQVTLYGSGFDNYGNKINFGNYEVYSLNNINSYDAATLTFNIPYSDDYSCQHTSPSCSISNHVIPAGNYNVSVTNSGGTSNSVVYSKTN
ncbi:MAG TPA: peptidoglycan-binding protein [Candidatus Paceibacterota bacterium]|nr:peptidoglycan-binding protein [Candidatus Paceibacterota bacterium]